MELFQDIVGQRGVEVVWHGEPTLIDPQPATALRAERNDLRYRLAATKDLYLLAAIDQAKKL